MAEEATQDVVVTNPDEGTQDELGSILDALNKDETVVEAKADTSSNNAGEQPYKKVGNLVFKTEADYDAWAAKNNGEVSRLTGELKKAQEAATKNPTIETKQDVQAIRMQIKVADFFEANPDAVEHKGVIAALLRSGKAKTLPEAYKGALRAAGHDVQEENNDTDVKNILKAGGNDSGVGAGSYNSNEDVKGTSDFADSALTGTI